MDLNSARLFAHVVQQGSFSKASRVSGIPLATVSRRVAELEASLGLRLLERTTRRLRLTDAGARFYGSLERGLDEIDAGLLALNEEQTLLQGRLRLSLPPGFEPFWNLLERFQAQYSRVELDVMVTERHVDFVEDGIDLAVRVGQTSAQATVARILHRYRHLLVASPEFLQQHSVEVPADIEALPCAVWAKSHQKPEWVLGDKHVSVKAVMRGNDYSLVRAAVLSGNYLGEMPPFLCRPLLDSGRLKTVLPDYPMPEQAVSLLYSDRRNLPAITRCFIDFCVAEYDARRLKFE